MSDGSGGGVFSRAYGALRTWAKAPGRRELILGARRRLVKLVPRTRMTLRWQAALGEKLGWTRIAARGRARLMTLDLPQKLRDRDLGFVLRMMGELEALERTAPLVAGRYIATLMSTEEGRETLRAAADNARADYPDSAYLTHVVTLCQSMAGDYRAAGEDLITRLKRPFRSDLRLERSRFEILRNSWRIADQAAREQMDWVDGTADYTSLATRSEEAEGVWSLGFKEPLLQGKAREPYLAACEVDLEAAQTLAATLKAIGEMIRPSLRHVLSYTSSYARARDHLEARREYWEPLFSTRPSAGAVESQVLNLCTMLKLFRKLNMEEEVTRVKERFAELANVSRYLPVMWVACAELVEAPDGVALADRIMSRIMLSNSPKTARDVRGFFRWAVISRQSVAARAVFSALPSRLKRENGALSYAQLLQAEGEFKAAFEVIEEVHAQEMSKTYTLNAFSSRSLIRRRGEVVFQRRTASIFREVPQPKDPVGVVLLSARNVDHLRRSPLMVLREMKRQGWAVVPLVAGLLPKEETGIAEIDLLHGCISPHIRLTPVAEAALPRIRDLKADRENGKLFWGDIDLSHAMWEDAAISRRSYHVDWGCPELRAYQDNLIAWTEAFCRAMVHLRQVQEDRGMRAATLNLFNARLPDAAMRFYPDALGEPERYFNLHGTNGYQNYFTNFATNISQRYVLRNMTRFPMARLASMPLPQHFGPYFERRKSDIKAIRERFDATPKIARSTGGQERPAAAQAAAERIEAWKAGGGRVVCAFGKVVFDSAVPFDGGPAHSSMKDWVNHCLESVEGTNTLLLMKPHPHEVNNKIATFPNEFFGDLLDREPGDNAMLLGHRWFDIADMAQWVDLGLIYNGTTCVELGLWGIPCVLAGNFAPVDYPVGHAVPRDRDHFARLVRGEEAPEIAEDCADRCAVWLDYMAAEDFTLPYRYHVRPVTNTVLYPPWWFVEDLERFREQGDPAIQTMLERALGYAGEPGGEPQLSDDEIAAYRVRLVEIAKAEEEARLAAEAEAAEREARLSEQGVLPEEEEADASEEERAEA